MVSHDGSTQKNKKQKKKRKAGARLQSKFLCQRVVYAKID